MILTKSQTKINPPTKPPINPPRCDWEAAYEEYLAALLERCTRPAMLDAWAEKFIR